MWAKVLPVSSTDPKHNSLPKNDGETYPHTSDDFWNTVAKVYQETLDKLRSKSKKSMPPERSEDKPRHYAKRLKGTKSYRRGWAAC